MNSRDRIRTALDHREPDRVPLDLGGLSVTGIHASAYARLRQALGLPYRPPKVIDPFLMLAEVEDDVRDALGIDTVGLRLPKTRFGFRNEAWKPWRLPDGTDVQVPGGFNPTRDENGDCLLHPQGDPALPASARMPRDGYYFDAIVRQRPLEEDPLDPQQWVREMFSVLSDEDLRYLEAEATRLRNESDRAILTNLPAGAIGDISYVPGTHLVQPSGIRDPMEWIIAHRSRPEYLQAIFAAQAEIAMKNLELLAQAVGNKVDVLYVSGTDFGTQDRALISPATYRALYRPHHRRLNDWIHRHTTWKAFYHSCGSLLDVLDDMVATGVDALNPVQCSAKGMEPSYLKERYGRSITFWGGGVDTQHTLPFGTPEEVYAQVRTRIAVFNRRGGYVFNPVHNVQQAVPTENMLAMFQAVREAQ